MTRVWFINQYARGTDSTGGTRHLVIARFLKGNHGISPVVIAGGQHLKSPLSLRAGDADLRDEDGVPFVRLPVLGYRGNGLRRVVSMFLFGLTVASSRKIRSIERPDVIVGSSPHLPAALAGWFLAVRLKAAFVLEVRDIWPDSLVAVGGAAPLHPLVLFFRLLERFLYRRATLIVGLMPGLGEYLKLRHGDYNKFRYIPNGVDLSHFPLRPPTLHEGEFRVLYAGSHGAPNNLMVIVRAAAILEAEDFRTEDGERIIFTLMGDGLQKESLIAAVEEAGLSSVAFMPPKPKSSAWSAMVDADALVLTAHPTPLYRWGVSPNKLFDYFAAARPIVFGLDTPYDLVQSAGAGLTVPPDDAVSLAKAFRTLASRPRHELAEMGDRGRRCAEQFDAAKLSSDYAAVIDEACNR